MLGELSQGVTLNDSPLRVTSFLSQCRFGLKSLIIVFDSKVQFLYNCRDKKILGYIRNIMIII